MAEIDTEAILNRIPTYKDVEGYILLTSEGHFLKSSFDNSVCSQYAELWYRVADQARSAIKDMDALNDLTFLRVRTKKNEVLIAPDPQFLLIVFRSLTN
ncbi:hypothetical protein GJ496_002361 [Pomphorhynchus laevis]|nr:hypothetical protein GJ496_002361 [Pomphorhynchus laevis]